MPLLGVVSPCSRKSRDHPFAFFSPFRHVATTCSLQNGCIYYQFCCGLSTKTGRRQIIIIIIIIIKIIIIINIVAHDDEDTQHTLSDTGRTSL